ncbi:NERD domain-containing protein [Streptomyces alkaliphilus]|uniref:NERD domain-containing protein n=1 Tax=Streptomyces alkaliphilus TaxID=1472722 RepID=UPI00117DA6CA|nr:NERD domain-containing protein [Streptomyces alkaliphilus]MQS10282.1 NERD domain-containing protein [Streptomyces alkaliphilus]
MSAIPDPFASRRGPLWLHPDDDLAPNRPGEWLRGLPELSTAEPVLRRVTGRLLGRRAHLDELERRMTGEVLVGTALDRLEPTGRRTLHSLPLPARAVLAHLTIGPGGVFAVHTVNPAGGPVVLGAPGGPDGAGDLLRVGSRSEPHPRLCRRAAVRAAHVLARAAGEPVEVRPVLAVVSRRVRMVRRPADLLVLAIPDGTPPTVLDRGTPVLKPDRVEELYALARDRRIWHDGWG